jgi:propionyl-CoA carboxylase alpha chain
MANGRWRDGRLSTSFIPEEYPGGFKGVTPSPELLRRLAIIALSVEIRRRERFTRLGGRLNGEGHGTRADWVVAIGDGRVALTRDDAASAVAEWRPGDPLWSGRVEGEAMTVQIRPVAAGLRLSWRGVDVIAKVMTPRVAELESLMPVKKLADTSKHLLCPMPGLVIAIQAQPGQKVRLGETLAIVEAMKMENVLRAERDLTVKSIGVKPGDTLAVDAVIMEFE